MRPIRHARPTFFPAALKSYSLALKNSQKHRISSSAAKVISIGEGYGVRAQII